ncbi:MAG: DUF3524 domain-containing protein [Candidatus Latescibacteria bacterium]|nr:DUF3524 domain-containing protein [Candidatus Latescibacterota bacterium]
MSASPPVHARPWILIEPYYGGSHRHLIDGLVARLSGPLRFERWTLPPRRWKWRMRGAALHFAERWRRERPDAAGIFVTSLLDAAALRGLLPRGGRRAASAALLPREPARLSRARGRPP